MHEWMAPYYASLLGLLVLAVLVLIQFGVADLALIRAKHVPGTPVPADHGSFLFRATRAYANTYENLGLFLLLVLTCVLSGADPRWTAIGIGVFTVGRAAHMICYYVDLRTLRSTVFGVGALGELVLLAAAAFALR